MRNLFVLVLFILFTNLACATDEVIRDAEGNRHHTGLRHEKVFTHPKTGEKFHTGLLLDRPENVGLGRTHVTIADCTNLPASFDLKDVGVDLPVRNQGNCGSCWAHSKTASLMSAIMAGNGKYVNLSEQELVSCDTNNYGCSGGLLNQQEYQVTHGQGLLSDFPYTGTDSRCKQIPVAAQGTQFVNVGQSGRAPTVAEVQCAIFKSHTIPWIVAAAGNDWMNFPSDPSQNVVPSRSVCRNQGINHAIGVTGWRTGSDGKVYFKMRNSWGTSWGASGYAFMPLGCDQLGAEVAYIMTNVMPCQPPSVKLPVSVSINAGDTVVLAVKALDSVTFTWSVNGVSVGTGTDLPISPAADTIYKVTAVSSCGTAESSVKVTIVKSLQLD